MNFLNDILPLKNKLYRTALRITLNTQEAQDIVQNTLVKVWSRRDSCDEIRSIEAFAFTICRNLSLDYIKRKQHQTLPLDQANDLPIAATDDPFERLTQQENLTQIRQIIDSLPERQRTCMQLRDIEGLPYKEIAAILSITEDQVKINIFRARKAVKDKILRKN